MTRSTAHRFQQSQGIVAIWPVGFRRGWQWREILVVHAVIPEANPSGESDATAQRRKGHSVTSGTQGPLGMDKYSLRKRSDIVASGADSGQSGAENTASGAKTRESAGTP